MVKKPFYTIIFISWVVCITFLSLFSFSGVDLPSVKIPYLDKLVHFTFYFIASFLGVLVVRELFDARKIKNKSFVLLIASLIIYGIVIEVLQSTVTDSRSGEFLDFVANTIGVFVGYVSAKFLFLKK